MKNSTLLLTSNLMNLYFFCTQQWSKTKALKKNVLKKRSKNGLDQRHRVGQSTSDLMNANSVVQEHKKSSTRSMQNKFSFFFLFSFSFHTPKSKFGPNPGVPSFYQGLGFSICFMHILLCHDETNSLFA